MTKRLEKFLMIAVVAALALATLPARAQAVAPAGAPPEGSSEIGNWGNVPFVAQDTLVLRAEDRAAIRRLEDKHVKDFRDIEDRFEGEIKALRQRHADEREALRRSFRR